MVTLVCSHSLPNLRELAGESFLRQSLIFCLRCQRPICCLTIPLVLSKRCVQVYCQCGEEFQAAILVRSLPSHRCSTVCRRFSLHYWRLIPQSIRRCVFLLVPLKSTHLNRLDSLQSNNHQPLTPLGGIAFVFCDKWPKFIGTDFLGLHRLNLSIVYQLCLLTRCTNNANDRVNRLILTCG